MNLIILGVFYDSMIRGYFFFYKLYNRLILWFNYFECFYISIKLN